MLALAGPESRHGRPLKKELKDQFLPLNTAWVARESFKNLKHTSTVRDYVKDFSSLMLYIKNMSEEDKLLSLQPEAQAELRRQGEKDLPVTIVAADGLVDYKVSSSSTENKKWNNNKKNKSNNQKYGKKSDGQKKK